jgi:hypothetical protein
MSDQPSTFELPKRIERMLATLSNVYERDGLLDLQNILVNAKPQFGAVWTNDEYDGTIHALHLILPAALFKLSSKEKAKFELKLKNDLNDSRSTRQELIGEVLIVMCRSGDGGRARGAGCSRVQSDR